MTNAMIDARSVPDFPRVTFALFAYNQEQYIREAVEGAFSQTYEPLEIILSDDCSADRTYEIMQEMAAAYEGPHKVRVRRSQVNRGISSHFTEVIEQSSGDYIVLAAGDDISLPERTTASVIPMFKSTKLNFSEVTVCDFEGSSLDALKLTRKTTKSVQNSPIEFSIYDYIENRAPKLVGAARTIKKTAYLQYNQLNDCCPTEDTPSIVRLLMTGNGLCVGGKFILRRIHEKNLSNIGFKEASRFRLIESQYRDDIKYIYKKNIIDKSLRSTLLRWSGDRTARKIQGILFSKDDSSLKKITTFIFTKEMRFRHKVLSASDLVTKKLGVGKVKWK